MPDHGAARGAGPAVNIVRNRENFRVIKHDLKDRVMCLASAVEHHVQAEKPGIVGHVSGHEAFLARGLPANALAIYLGITAAL